MEMEKLEIIIEANAERVEKNLSKIMPFVEKWAKNMGMTLGKGTEKAEKDMDISNGVNRMEKQMEQMTKFMEKQMDFMEKQSEKFSDNLSKNMSNGVTKARKVVGKDVDMLVNEINSKLKQADAKQRQIAYLKAQRQDASKNKDEGSVVKYDNQIANAEAQLSKYEDKAIGISRAMRSEYKDINEQIQKMTSSMTSQKNVINAQKDKIKELNALYESQAKKVSKASESQRQALHNKYQDKGGIFNKDYQKELDSYGYKFEDNKISNKTRIELEKQSRAVNKLVEQYNKLSQTQAMLKNRSNVLAGGLKSTADMFGQHSRQTETAGSGVRRFGRITEGTRGLMSRMNNLPNVFGRTAKSGFGIASLAVTKFSNGFNRMSHGMDRGLARNRSGMFTFGTQMKMMLNTLIFYGLMYQAILKLGQGLFSALKANEEFSTSLNQIKVNLLTAFYPIYEAILPAINALMRALSQATAYLAGFTAALFGTTYSAAKQGAKGLYESIQAMNESGTAADKNKEKIKQMQRSLMGFDEINNLSKNVKDDDTDEKKPGVDFSIPDQKIPDWVAGWANQAKKLWKDFFKPIADAWANQGQRVMDSFKYALNEIWALIKSVGRSFMEVWTNGTGQRFVENILILLADVLYIIGDIARAFREAWEENNRGTRLIQSIFDSLSAVLELLHEVAEAFRNAWNDNGLGRSIIGNILDILTNVFNTITNISDGLKEAWTQGNVGQSIFSTILTIVNDLLSAIERMTRKTAEWADELDFTPLLMSIDSLLKSIEPLTKKVFDGLAWAWENIFLPLAGFTIEDVLPAFFNLLSGALDVLNSVIELLKPLFIWLWDEMLEPIAEWTGGKIVDILNDLGDALTGISDWIEKNQKTIENIAIVVGSFAAAWWLVNTAVGVWTVVGAIASGVTTILAAATSILAGAIAFLTSPITLTILAIGALIAIGVLLWRNWDTIKEKASEIWEKISTGIGSFIDGIGEYVSDFFEAGGNFIDGLLEGISEKLSGIWTWMKENIYNPIVDGFKSLFGIHSPSTVFAEFGGFLIDGLYNGIKELISKPVELVGTLFGDMKTKVSDKTTEIFDKSKELWGKTKDTIGGFTGKIKDGVSEKFGGAWETTKKTWNSVSDWTSKTWGNTKKSVGSAVDDAKKSVSNKWSDISKETSKVWGNVSKWTSDKWSSAKKSVTDNSKNIWDNTKQRWSDVGKNTKKTWDDFTNKISNSTKNAKTNASERMNDLKNNLRNRFGETWSSARSSFDNIYSKITNQSNNSNARSSSAFRSLSKGISGSVNGMKNTVKSVFDNIGKWASELPGKIAKGLTSGVDAIKKAAGKIGDGLTGVLGGAVNGVISGIKWVLEKVGAGSAAKELGKFTVPKYPKYATGTGYHPGGYAWVNDGSGSNYREAFQTPDGRMGLFPQQRNMLVDLPKGSSVLSGPRTAQMMRGLPAYKNGVGNWFKETWSKTKEIASNIWSYAKDPSKLLTAAVSKYVKLGNVVDPTLTIAKGAVGKMIDGAKGFVTDKFNIGHEKYKAEQEASNVGHDGSIDKGWGVFSYLRTIADKTIAKFGNGLRITSGQRDGDPYYHGRRQAVDIALPANMNGSSLNKQIANWVFDTYRNQVAYVITNGQVRDRSGFSGQGTSGKWVRWPDNDHYDHVHINGLLSSKDIATTQQKAFESVRGSSAGSVARTIWNGLRANSYSKQAAAGILGNVEAESSMNPDLDELYGPGYGIVQWTSPYRSQSGRAYVQSLMKRAGIKGDYRTAEAQTKLLLWHMKNGQWIGQVDPKSVSAFKKTKSVPTATYAFLKNFERAGVEHLDRRYNSAYKYYNQLKGYANGGWVTRDGIYRMGEGNKREMVVPVDKPSLALERISQIFDYMGIDWTDSSISMPKVFEPSSFAQPSKAVGNKSVEQHDNDSIQHQFTQNQQRTSNEEFVGNNDIYRVLLAILNTQNSGNEGHSGGNTKTEVSVKVDRNTLFKLMIEEGKKIEKQTGKNPFNG